MNSEPKNPIPQINHSDSVNVPTFGCIVYVSQVEGGIQARVANLADLNCVGASERDALSKIIPAFKQRIIEFMQAETEVPWIDPPAPIRGDEQKRFVPVHL